MVKRKNISIVNVLFPNRKISNNSNNNLIVWEKAISDYYHSVIEEIQIKIWGIYIIDIMCTLLYCFLFKSHVLLIVISSCPILIAMFCFYYHMKKCEESLNKLKNKYKIHMYIDNYIHVSILLL
ncbi:hypothetical protein SAMN05661086_01827 [Anaeromicropila populeti]|uniref:Uncharacterized protein n=1 Tax=Anaeromicropila populeti TaxID=37658 RepID=A0A1I6JP54_9FIRM|nr:hypothetical protein SAMN05661086_01827 [Anaeromicropila populeti]